jgi:hypothetical protein
MNKKELYSMWEMSVGGVGGISPTNSVAGGSIAGLPPDQPLIKKRLDGRKRDVRKFVKKLLTNRQKREEIKLKKQNQVNEDLLNESGGKVIDQLKKIANSGATGNVVFDNGGKTQASPQEAAKIVSLYRELSASNRVKLIRNINTSSSNYEKIKAFAQSRSQ